MNVTNLLAWLCAMLLTILLVHGIMGAIDAQGEIDDARIKAHVERMDDETRRVIGGEK